MTATTGRSTIVVDEAIAAAALELAELRAQAAKIALREKELRTELLAALDAAGSDRAITAAGLPVCHLEYQERRTVNARRLEAMWPEIHAQVVEAKPVIVVKVG